MPINRVTLQYRFADKIFHTADCWLWTGKKTVAGYGQVCLVVGDDKSIYAHRLSWIIHNGPIPDDLCVLHNCPTGDNPSCVNPDHLFLGTRGDNRRDCVKKGRDAPYPRPGAGNYRVTDEQVEEILRRKAKGENSRLLGQEFGLSKGRVNTLFRNGGRPKRV